MAYFRTNKNGDKRLILTAKDKAKQQQRCEVGWRYRTRRHVRAFKRNLGQQEIAWIYRLNNKGMDNVAEWLEQEQQYLIEQRRKLHATLKWSRLGQWSDHVHSSGYVEIVRDNIVNIEEKIRHYRWLLNHAR